MAEILRETLAADGQTAEVSLSNPNNGANIFQNVYAFGTFGAGTATLQVSPDGGTTWIDVTDGISTVSFTSNGGQRTFILGNANPILAEQIKLRFNLTGSSTPSVTFVIEDCR